MDLATGHPQSSQPLPSFRRTAGPGHPDDAAVSQEWHSGREPPGQVGVFRHQVSMGRTPAHQVNRRHDRLALLPARATETSQAGERRLFTGGQLESGRVCGCGNTFLIACSSFQAWLQIVSQTQEARTDR